MSTMMDAQALGKKLVSSLTDGDISRIISLKAVGFSTVEIPRLLFRRESTIRSFFKKWNSQCGFSGQVGRPKKDDRADEVIEATIRDRRSSIRQVGAALALTVNKSVSHGSEIISTFTTPFLSPRARSGSEISRPLK
jgi:hypothetical protein